MNLDWSQPEQASSPQLDWSHPDNGQIKTPKDVTQAEGYIDNPNMNQHQGMCQQFVEQVAYNKTGMFPSAIDAWNNYSQSGQARQGTKGIQPGDIIYFSPNDSNEGYGHTGIYTGNNKFVSATDNGVENQNLNDWEKLTNQEILGYIKNPQNLPQIGGTQ